MTVSEIYKQLEGKTIHAPSYHPTIVDDVGNDTSVDITVGGGYAKYKGVSLNLTSKGWQSLYIAYQASKQ